jgi:serine/threonine protein kinase
MTPAADDDKTAFTPRPDSGFAPTNFAPTAPVQPTEVMAPPAAQSRFADMGNGLPVGTRLGEFEITSLLGEGGFGIVYLSIDHSLGRRVALKEYMPSSLAARTEAGVQVKSERHRETFEAGRKSFVNEARLLAQFDHPSLVKVYRFWEANGTAYMVMPFYEGKNLRDTLRERIVAGNHPPDEAWLRTLLLPLTEALRVIHAEQCYHRDIAPDNVMMLAGSQRPLLLDFGAARRVIGDMTQALTVILKPGYAPIEQYAEVPGMRQGPWTDVYALAAVVYFAITGKTPPVSVGRMMNDSYVPLAHAAAGRYSVQFLEAVDRALVVRPEQRTQTIEAFRDDLGLLEHNTAMGATTQMRPPADGNDVTRIAPSTQARRSDGAPTQVHVPPTQMAPARTQQGPAPQPFEQQLFGDQPPTQQRPAPTRMAPPATARPQPAAPRQAPQAEVSEGRRGSAAGIAAAVALVVAGGGGYFWWSRRDKGESTASIAPAPAPAAPSPAPVPAPAPSVPAPAPAPAPGVPPPAPATAATFDAVREFDKALQAQSTGFGLRASAPKTALRIGRDDFRFSVQSDRDGYLYVLGVQPDGAMAQLVPNRRSGPVRLRAGQPWQFPAKDGFVLLADEPAGASQLLLLVSAQPRTFDALQPRAEGDIRLFPGGDTAAAALARHTGAGSVVAGRATCPAGAASCDESYGAALLKFDVVR